ncbi:MAG: hypothetical protein J5I93_15435 [Pirellulaceae bacterium]|nr:hypothetical protein [Pirellulaceae bacterium]
MRPGNPPRDSERPLKPGLYDLLLTLAVEQQLDQLSDPRLWAVAPVDAEDAHAAIAQFLERLLAASLAAFRGSEAADRQRRLVERILAALADELGPDWTERLRHTPGTRRQATSARQRPQLDPAAATENDCRPA